MASWPTTPSKGGSGSRVTSKEWGQKLSGIGGRVCRHLFRCPLSDNEPATLAPLWTHINDPVCRLDHIEIVFNDDYSITMISESVQDIQ